MMVSDIYRGIGVLLLISSGLTKHEDPNAIGTVKDAFVETNTEKERKEEALALIAPYSNWDQYLMSAPMVIDLLGQLMIISSDTDFTLENKPPKEGFKYLKYPNSFRTSLVQISNVGWEAFNKAHTNMDQIRLYTINVDSYVNTLVKVLMHGSREEVSSLVPYLMSKIQKAADACLNLASGVENKYIEFMQLTGELLEASTNAKGIYEDELKATIRAIKVAKQEGKNAREEKKRMENDYARGVFDVHSAQEHLEEVLELTPSSLKVAGYYILDAALNILRVHYVPVPKHHFEYEESESEAETDEKRSDGQVYAYAISINENIQILVSTLTSGNKGGEKLPDWNNSELVQMANMTLGAILGNIERVEKYTYVKQTAMKLCRNGIRLSQQFINMRNSLHDRNKEVLRQMVISAEDLLEESKNFYKDAASFLHITNTNSPRFSKKSKTIKSNSLVQAEYEIYRLKVESAEEVLQDTRKRQENINKDMKENNDRLQRTVEELARTNLKKIDFDTVRSTLIKGLHAIKGLREQWSNLVMFFQFISNIAKGSMSDSIDVFVNIVELGTKQKIDKDDILDLTRDLIAENAFKTSSVANFVRVISSTYVEVSSAYLMREVNSLGRLVALDPENDEQKIKDEQKKLSDNSKVAQEGIKAKKEEKQREYFENIDKRIKKLRSEVKPRIHLPDLKERETLGTKTEHHLENPLFDKTEL